MYAHQAERVAPTRLCLWTLESIHQCRSMGNQYLGICSSDSGNHLSRLLTTASAPAGERLDQLVQRRRIRNRLFNLLLFLRSLGFHGNQSYLVRSP